MPISSKADATQSKSIRTNSTQVHRQTSATEVKFHLDQSFDLRTVRIWCCVALFHDFCVLVRRRSMHRTGWSTVQVPDGWLHTIKGPCPQSNKWPARDRQSSKPTSEGPQVTGQSLARGQPRPASKGSYVDRQGTGAESGGGNGSCGLRPHYALARCVKESEGPSVKCARWRAKVSQAQEALAKVQSKLQFEEQGLRRRGTIGGTHPVPCRGRAKSGRSFPSRQFRPRACRVASMSIRVTARELGFACAVAIRSRRRRARTQTSQKIGNVLSRIGPFEPWRRRPWSGCGAMHAFDGRRFT